MSISSRSFISAGTGHLAQLSLCGIVLLVIAAPAGAGSRIDELRNADPSGHVEVTNTSGTVEIRGWDRPEVEVSGELGKGSERLEFETSGKVTHIKVVMPERSRGVEASDLRIRVPVGSSVAVNTVSADITVRDVSGAQRLQTVSGDIEAGDSANEIECKSVSGDVELTGSGASGIFTITTVSGDAELSNVAGEINANTVSGDIQMMTGTMTRSRLRSTSGDLEMTSTLSGDARLDVESISGDVRIDLRGDVNAEFDVSSFNGEIRNCFNQTARRTSEYAPGRELRFREGTGTARIRVKTLNGDVSVCRD